jgi:(1->4)-alpha-D-glucan 1-alpha-D-glucosylmutase
MASPVPASTYRLQITPEFTLYDAARLIPYLHRLGADWVYCSPLLAAEPGSNHGYDVIDHSRTDPSRGGREGLAALADAAHARGMGVLVDIVPNHVGVASPLLSVWWRDLLTHGRASRYAAAFDVDWAAGDGKVLIPVLGDGDEPPAALTLDRATGALRYYEHAFPLAPGSAPPGAPATEVLDRQHYRLVNFRLADTDLNYRRFFAVTSLAGIRVEDPAVFAESHAEIRHWIDSGWVDGLRVDHPDGLADPRGYLDMLAELSGGRYTVVEKILEPGEELPRDWRCAGTTGYDALALIDRVLVDPAGEPALSALDAELRVADGSRHGPLADWPELVHGTKRAVADGILGSEVRRLVRLLPPADGEADRPRRIDAVAELVANLSVYRTYDADDPELTAALARARARRPDLAAEFDAIQRAAHDAGSEFAIRLQQTSGAVMAKGVEDCAFYRYPRLTSLTEVGGDPSVFSVPPAQFHAAIAHRWATWPDSMTTLSTHDTKRGEDVRARISVLAELPDEWAAAVSSWVDRLRFPDPVLANLLFQTAVGAWPIERDRLHGYAEKAAREAGDSTGWIDPDAAFEKDMHDLVDACCPGGALHAEVAVFADRIRAAGWSNSLSATLVQLTLPGVPDVYRGTELWSNDLVDPDNRRPFDALADGGAADMLARLDERWLPPVDATGAVKLLVTSRALRARRDRPELFTGYQPLAASGPEADHVLAFDRGGAITVATRLPIGLSRRGGWADTVVHLPPGTWRDAIAGNSVLPGAAARVGDVLRRYPAALLLAE